MSTIGLAAWHALVAQARRRGEVLNVIDRAREGLAEYPGDLRLEYEKTLAYARAGATTEAEANLRAVHAAGALGALDDPLLAMEYGALHARLLKDRAYAATEARPALARQAAAAYEAVYRTTNQSFPAINAATLYRIAGDAAASHTLAEAALTRAAAEPPGFWQGATRAEAYLLLGDLEAAKTALQAAVASGVELDELATTRRQLAWLGSHLPGAADIVSDLPAPYLFCWTGTGPLPEPLPIPAARDGLPVLAYGAIIGLPDIVIAEALIAAGVHTNLVIGGEAAGCLAALEARAGSAWASRLKAVLAAARRVTEVTLEGDSTERTVADMAAQQASGLAAMRATALVTRLHTIHYGPASAPQPAAEPATRAARAFVFGDIRGYSAIPEAAHRPFLETVIGGFADALAELGPLVEYTETAGDGIFVVLADVIAALRCCRGLHEALMPERLREAGLPSHLGLRLGAHVGPVARGLDRVIGRQKFIGKEIIRTARIEAVTPVGETYVTEQFAATLHALSPVGHACEYVGWQAMAKGFGQCRMYTLRPTPQIIALLHGPAL